MLVFSYVNQNFYCKMKFLDYTLGQTSKCDGARQT